jgi:hypothetical protein
MVRAGRDHRGRIYFDVTMRWTSRTSGTGSSPSGTGDSGSGARSPSRHRWGVAGPQARRQRGDIHGHGRACPAGRPGDRRIGNYFNKELLGGPTHLPSGLGIPLAYRPPGYTAYATFQPSFLYELIWDSALAAFLIWLGHHRKIAPPGLFALYVTRYSAYRIFKESIRIDPPSTSSACG